jgi:hypothetical protein
MKCQQICLFGNIFIGVDRRRDEELSFNDLRHDFAHRAREAGWALEEVASYLGDVTVQGMPALQSTPPSMQVSREQLKPKLNNIKG